MIVLYHTEKLQKSNINDFYSNCCRLKYSSEQKDRIRALGYLLSLVARRALAFPDGTPSTTRTLLFLDRLHQLFQADYRITSIKDEWIFLDVNLLQKVIVKGLRMSLRVYQDHFIDDSYEIADKLFEALESKHELVLCHEGDVQWRESILADVKELFSFRKIKEERKNSPQHFMVMLELKPEKFRVFLQYKQIFMQIGNQIE